MAAPSPNGRRDAAWTDGGDDPCRRQYTESRDRSSRAEGRTGNRWIWLSTLPLLLGAAFLATGLIVAPKEREGTLVIFRGGRGARFSPQQYVQRLEKLRDEGFNVPPSMLDSAQERAWAALRRQRMARMLYVMAGAFCVAGVAMFLVVGRSHPVKNRLARIKPPRADINASVKVSQEHDPVCAPVASEPTRATSEEIANGQAIAKLRRIALQEPSALRLQAIRELGQLATRDAAAALLSITKEWSHQKGLADSLRTAVAEKAGQQVFKQMVDAAGRPGPGISFEEFRVLRETAVANAVSVVRQDPPADPGAVPVDAIASALAGTGGSAIKAMDAWLSIKVHPSVADVIIRTAEKIGGNDGVRVLERLSRGYVDAGTAELARQTAKRVRMGGPYKERI